MMEVLKYIDKVKAWNYALKIAKERGIPQSKLCKGIYDPSNFYKICHDPTDAKINFEKLNQLLQRLNIGKSMIEQNCTIFDSRTIELMDVLNEEGNAYTFENYPAYLKELEELNPKPITELTQFILWRYGVYEFSIHHYEDASAYFLRAIDKTQSDFSFEKIKNCKLDDQEIAICLGYIMSEFMLNPHVISDRYLQMLLDQKPDNDELISLIYMYRCAALLQLQRYEDASAIITKGLQEAKSRRTVVNLPHLNYMDGIVSWILHKNKENLDKARLLCEAYGIEPERLDFFYNLPI